MGVILSPIRMGTMLPGLMSMHIPDPMSIHIHPGIIDPIITPIDGEVGHRKLWKLLDSSVAASSLSTGVVCNVRAQELEKSGCSSRATSPGAFDQTDLSNRKPMDGD